MSLISVAAPRRARSANWSYHFSEGSGEWFDITLSLPYHIILYEVQIRPHVPTLNSEFSTFFKKVLLFYLNSGPHLGAGVHHVFLTKISRKGFWRQKNGMVEMKTELAGLDQ